MVLEDTVETLARAEEEAAGLTHDPARTFGITELARTFGVTARTIRFYEDEGLLAPGRDGQTRIYSHRDRGRLALICRGKRLGFSLAEIREFLSLYSVDGAQVEQMRFGLKIARDRITALEAQLADVHRTLDELKSIEGAIVDHLASTGDGDPSGDIGTNSRTCSKG